MYCKKEDLEEGTLLNVRINLIIKYLNQGLNLDEISKTIFLSKSRLKIMIDKYIKESNER